MKRPGRFPMQFGVGKMNPRFSDRILRLLERVSHRCVETRMDREAVARIRHDTDFRQRLIEPRIDDRRDDAFHDDAPNAWVIMTLVDGELASTLRIHVAADENESIPSLDAFSDVIFPRLQAGQSIVETTRLAAQVDLTRMHPELSYIALRPAWLAAEHFEVDYLLTTVVEQHQAFYRYALGYQPWGEARDDRSGGSRAVCMALDFNAARSRIESRYPFFRSTGPERGALFGRLTERRRPASGARDGRPHAPPSAE